IAVERDETQIADVRAVLATVQRYPGRFGTTRLTDILYGTTSKAVLASRLHHSTTFGELRRLGRSGIAQLIKRLIAGGYLRVDGLEFPVLEATPSGMDLLTGVSVLQWHVLESHRERPTVPRSALKSTSAPLLGADQDMFERLRQLRLRLATEEGIAPFVVFHDKTLRQLVATKPTTLADLEQVPGIGPAKLERYGRQLLAVLNGDG